MLKQYKWTLILSSLTTLLPIPILLLMGEPLGTFGSLPLTLLAAQLFCFYWTVRDPGNKNQNPKPLKLVLWIMPVISNFTTFISYALISGWEFSVSSIYCLASGVMFAAIGNYLPKVKMNHTMGIKVSWAYTSEANWNATHRFGGKVWFLCGLILIAAAPLPLGWGVSTMLVVITAACVIPIVYSYCFYRRQMANSEVVQPPSVLPARYQKFSFVFLAALAVFICGVLFTGNLQYQFEEDHLFVKASYHDDLRLYYGDIEDIEYRDANVSGTRVWGYGSFRLLMGTFQNEEFGTYTRYTYYDPQSAVVITAPNQTFVLSGRDTAETKALYNSLLEKIEE